MERLMQFVWAHRLGMHLDMRTVDGRRVRVVDQGTLNVDAGPDFFNASIEIGEECWAGNVEIHVRASDWYRHGHDRDRAYDSVILHVVQYDDAPVYRSDGALIPQMVMACDPSGAARCNYLVNAAGAMLPCRMTLLKLPEIYKTDWLTALAMERVYAKSDRVMAFVDESKGDWEGAAYVTFARGLGFGLNSEPFELLARHLPLRFLYKHADDIQIVESFFFGQAGLFPPYEEGEDGYLTRLRQEHRFMCSKFGLRSLPLVWKMARTRPQNFPHRRLALLAQKIHEGFGLMGSLLDAPDVDSMRRLFDVKLMGFWTNHYTFSAKGGCSPRALSERSVDSLLIDVAVPLLCARGRSLDDPEAMERAIALLQALKPEDNAITRLFADAGIGLRDAFVSQALIQLKREYCEKKKCIYCRFGQRMLSKEIFKG